MTNKLKSSVALQTLGAAGQFFKNKAAVMAALAFCSWKYVNLPAGPESAPVPFLEVAYASLLVGWIFVLAPLARLLVFPEAAEYAESGKLREALKPAGSQVTPALIHYWFATALCYIVVIFCVATISK